MDDCSQLISAEWYVQGFRNRDITLRNAILVWLIASEKYFSKKALLDSTVGVQRIFSGPHLQLLSHSPALRWFIDFLSIFSLLIHSLTLYKGASCSTKDIGTCLLAYGPAAMHPLGSDTLSQFVFFW